MNKLCCMIHPVIKCHDCGGGICKDHFFKKRASDENRCLKCFRRQILSHRTGKQK